MSKPINCIAQRPVNHLVPPAIIIAFAMLAGTTRLIQYFEGASKGGLLLSAGFSSAGTLLYDNYSKDKQHTLMGRILAITAGTLVAYGVAKGLEGRLSLSSGATMKFVFGASTCVSLPYLINKPAKQSLTSEEKHLYYSKQPASWQALSPKQRSELVNEFHQNNQPLISLKNLKLDRATLNGNLLGFAGDLSLWQEEVLLTQDLRLLETLQYQPDADYTSLIAFLNRYPELKFLINKPFIKASGHNFQPTIASLRGRISRVDDINALSLAQLKGYHTAFTNDNFNYNSNAIHQAFRNRFRQLGMRTDTILLTMRRDHFHDQSGNEMKISIM